MPKSQLKQLKASLRDAGKIGPSKSKKGSAKPGKSPQHGKTKGERAADLAALREQFNPFEAKPGKNNAKFSFQSNNAESKSISRPGVTKGLGEENRRKTLLLELKRRQKVGGVLDRRFGENDPTMTPEERAMERFVQSRQRSARKGTLFDLEDEGDDENMLTHGGSALDLSGSMIQDDYGDSDGEGEDSDIDADSGRQTKRRRLSGDDPPQEDGEEAPLRRKTKNEVMREVIAKSKLHKYERQQAKEDDDDLRAELDGELQDVFALLRGVKPPTSGSNGNDVQRSEPALNPERAAIIGGRERDEVEKEYDERVRQMALDPRSNPTTKTMTEEDRAAATAERLKDLEEQRQRRMQENVSDEDENEDYDSGAEYDDPFERQPTQTSTASSSRNNLVLDDEDEFLIEDDLIAGSADESLAESEGEGSSEGEEAELDSDDDEFVANLVTSADANRDDLEGFNDSKSARSQPTDSGLAFTYPCPQNVKEFRSVIGKSSGSDIITIIQRIRALYHPKLGGDNKQKLGVFATALLDYTLSIVKPDDRPDMAIVQQYIRHIHSLAKTFPLEVSEHIRTLLLAMSEERPLDPSPADLMLFTIIGTIYPTSDRKHAIVDPARLIMSKLLSQKIPKTLSHLVVWTLINANLLQYEQISKRYIPDTVSTILATLHYLSPNAPSKDFGQYIFHGRIEALQIKNLPQDKFDIDRKTKFWDMAITPADSASTQEEVKLAVLSTNMTIIDMLSEMWIASVAYIEIFEPIAEACKHLLQQSNARALPKELIAKIKTTLAKLERLIQQARINRKPLQLHNHRPLAIKTYAPKFEEAYNPDRHYDPDRERSDLNKLKAEHKRERKGALRELRKDANFIARESLREKKERDAAYEKKYRRLVAEIQGEEGHEKNEYEREKKMRKKAKR